MIRMGETPDSAASPASTKSIPWKGLPFIQSRPELSVCGILTIFCEYPMDEFVY